jgi:hypothetical protein
VAPPHKAAAVAKPKPEKKKGKKANTRADRGIYTHYYFNNGVRTTWKQI